MSNKAPADMGFVAVVDEQVPVAASHHGLKFACYEGFAEVAGLSKMPRRPRVVRRVRDELRCVWVEGLGISTSRAPVRRSSGRITQKWELIQYQ